jgi:hypothetical protein
MAEPKDDPEFYLGANPFTTEYLEEEIDFYDLSVEYESGGVRVAMRTPKGNFPDYLNKSWKIEEVEFPVMWIDGRVWMSLSWMEVQSAFVAVRMAQGRIATAGLGLGYYPLRTAAQEDVESVDVYELNPKVIKFFTETFKNRPEFDKINIIQGDVRKEMKDKYDFIFMDIYRTLLPDEVIPDIGHFAKNVRNDVELYRFWGQEAVILDALFMEMEPKLEFIEEMFFKVWARTPIDPDDPTLGNLDSMYEPQVDEDYAEQVLDMLGRLK